MAERSTTTPAAAAAPERDRLLATKLHIPRPRPGFLARPRLLGRLTQGTTGALILVCAPAGFGKTSLLGDWARRGQRPLAWLSLDGGDSDPARFWRYVATALDRARPGVRERVEALFKGGQPPLEAVVTVVVNELVEGPEQVVLVLDDYHLVEAPPVHDSLAVLLERLPPQLRLVLASRADPPLPLARLRAGGQRIAGSGLGWTTLRATQFQHLTLLTVRQLARLPVVPVPAGWRFQPIDPAEVADRLVELALGAPAGLVADLGGPRVYTLAELVRGYLEAVGKHRPILPLPLPGKANRAFRAGANLAPERAVGRRTWEEFLAGQVSAPTPAGQGRAGV